MKTVLIPPRSSFPLTPIVGGAEIPRVARVNAMLRYLLISVAAQGSKSSESNPVMDAIREMLHE